MKLRELVLRNRSYRRFKQEVSIEPEALRQLVDLPRSSASEANLQPLKYILSCDAQKNVKYLEKSAGFLAFHLKATNHY